MKTLLTMCVLVLFASTGVSQDYDEGGGDYGAAPESGGGDEGAAEPFDGDSGGYPDEPAEVDPPPQSAPPPSQPSGGGDEEFEDGGLGIQFDESEEPPVENGEPQSPELSGGGDEDSAEQDAPFEKTPIPEIGVRKADRPVFGSYRVRMSVVRPKFNDDLKFYDDLYGKPKQYPMIQADWFAWDWYATLGLSLRAGWYSADGYTAADTGVAKDDINTDNIARDFNGPTTLTLVPIQTVFTLEFTPLKQKWLVIDAWYGFEQLYWQEVRTEAGTDNAAMIALQTETEDTDTSLVNKGWKTLSVMGASANILLNGLDGRSVGALEAMGIGYVYLSPYMEVVTNLSKSGVAFGRSNIGLGFTFETIR